jgi:Arc/MetJ family transcription regulator
MVGFYKGSSHPAWTVTMRLERRRSGNVGNRRGTPVGNSTNSRNLPHRGDAAAQGRQQKVGAPLQPGDVLLFNAHLLDHALLRQLMSMPQSNSRSSTSSPVRAATRVHSSGMEQALRIERQCVYIRQSIHILECATMRTNIEIDDELLTEAMAAAGLSTKRATVEEGLRMLVRVLGQAKALAELKGLGWEGDLDEMRAGRRRVEV